MSTPRLERIAVEARDFEFEHALAFVFSNQRYEACVFKRGWGPAQVAAALRQLADHIEQEQA